MTTHVAVSKEGPILVVDDNEMNRDLLSRRLRKRGYEVDVADGGEQALSMIDSHPYDLVLLDIMMPGIDGYEVLDRVRTKLDAGDLPVIMATARDASEDVVEALKKGANDYVTKPFDFPVVLARVKTQMALRRSRRDLEVAHQRMKKDLEAAARIQQSFLPSDEVSVAGADFAWRYLPCDELAGDTLNIVPLDDRHVGCFVIDVRGHGVPAALLSVTLSRLMSPEIDSSSILWTRDEGQAGFRIAFPVEVADELARRFPYDESTGQYFTLLYGVLDLEAGEFRFVSAGHPYLSHLPAAGAPVLHRPTGPPIGLVSAAIMPTVFTESKFRVGPGDRVYIYSDGIPETEEPGGEEYGSERLTETLVEGRSSNLEASILTLLDHVRHFSGVSHFDDDVSVVAFEIPS